MVHIFMWNGDEYVFVKFASQEYLRNLMADPVWTEYDMCYLAW